jgi:signal peptidase I
VDATPPPVAEPDPLPLPPPAPDLPLPLPAPEPSAEPPHPPVGFTLRRLCHILVLLFSLFLVVRTTFVEPFGVTTGSMAETIHGDRREKVCPRCGHRVCVGSADDTRGSKSPQDGARCTNCGFGPFDVSGEAETFGDRLMVDKLVFRLRPPRRWEVAVFRCPEPEGKDAKAARGEVSLVEAKLPLADDRKPYVKRVVGLPGESVRVFDGDVYANGLLQRKSLAQVRETRTPVFQMDHPPTTPGGWAVRWEVGPAVGSPQLPKGGPPPALPEVAVRGDALVLDATAAPFAVTYRHRDPDTRSDYPVDDRFGYNGSRPHNPVPVHDFMVGCEVEVVGGQGGAFTVRLGDGADTVKVHLPIGADAGAALVAHEGGGERGFDKPFALTPGKRHTLEFGFIDRRVTVALDGREVAAALDLPDVRGDRQPRKPIAGRPTGSEWAGLTRPVQLECRGGHVVVHHFVLWRDIHYRGDLGGGKHGVAGECRLGADEYFMLGDNTANSKDSREWTTPGVPERDFLGKPFLVHQPLKATTVPVLGRVQGVDWERFRLLE